MKHTKDEKKTILIGLLGIIAMIFSMYLSFYCATINDDFMPLIVFTTTCIYCELKDKYKYRRDKEDNEMEK